MIKMMERDGVFIEQQPVEEQGSLSLQCQGAQTVALQNQPRGMESPFLLPGIAVFF